MLETSTLKFLKDLNKHNNKAWFDANRKAYDATRQSFEAFVASVIQDLGKSDKEIAALEAKACMFRINRDVRLRVLYPVVRDPLSSFPSSRISSE